VVADCAVDHWYDMLRYGLGARHAVKSAEPARTYPKRSIGGMYGTPETYEAERARARERRWG
jgi:hypothetical protein